MSGSTSPQNRATSASSAGALTSTIGSTAWHGPGDTTGELKTSNCRTPRQSSNRRTRHPPFPPSHPMYRCPLLSHITSCPRPAISSASCCAYTFTPPPRAAPSITLAQLTIRIRIRAQAYRPPPRPLLFTARPPLCRKENSAPPNNTGNHLERPMAVITCDRCEKPIDVPNPVMGQKVTCPSCGDVNIIRSLSSPPPGGVTTDRAAAAGYPPAFGPEADVITVRPAMFRAKPVRFLFLFAVLIAGAVGGFMLGIATPLAILCFAGAGLALLWLLVWKIHTLGEGLKITTKRTIDQHGLFSKDTSDVLHVDS